MNGRTSTSAAPEHWRLRPRRTMGISVLAAMAGAGILCWASAEWSKHYLGVAVSLAGWGLTVLAGAAMTFLMNAAVLHGDVADAQDGLVLSPSRTLDVIARLATAVMAVSGVVGVVVWCRGGAEMAELSTRQHSRWVLASVLLAGVGLSACPRWFTRLGPLGSLRLSPAGVEYKQGWSTVRLAWRDIAEVIDEYPSKRKMPCPITFRLRSGDLKVFVPGAYGRDPAQIYWMIQHYWRHPDRRTELPDGQAGQRLRRGDFSSASSVGFQF
jgi:hypothetical protein